MIPEIQEVNFPQYATLSSATATLNDMGEKTITTSVKIDGAVTPDFSQDWVIIFKGEKYIMPLRQPQAAKENTSLNSSIELTFVHWAQYQLQRYFFVEMTSTESGTAIADQYVASVSLTLPDFCALLAKVLNHWYGDTITIDYNSNYAASSEPTGVEISYSYIWDILGKIYDLYAVRWTIEPNGSADKYVIKIGYAASEISHIFEYGFNGGLLKVERQVQDDKICNMLLGRGGEKNLPYRYFKQTDENNKGFSPDPDWIPELANIYFTNLRGATFRSYIQGWKAKHYNGTALKADAYAPWAWEKGYTDTKFNPVEYVKDDESIAKYGELMGGLDNNDDIYPTIQGVVLSGIGRVDEAVAVEQITSDDIEQRVTGDAVTSNINPVDTIQELKGYERKSFVIEGAEFTIPEDKVGNITAEVKVLKVYIYNNGLMDTSAVAIENGYIRVVNTQTQEIIAASGIPSGTYRYQIVADLYNTYEFDKTYVTFGVEQVTLTYSSGRTTWANTFDIWIKNIWQTAKGADESAEHYAERVWSPILGDREGNEAKIVFSDGMLSTSEDYEFVIVGTPVFEQKQCSWTSGNTQYTYTSEWRITLAKSDADYDALGVYIPSVARQGKAGDHFFFIGIDMPHMYVTEAEKRLDDYKTDQLNDCKDGSLTWAITLDKIAVNQLYLEKEGENLIDLLKVGAAIRLADKRFITDSAYVSLYLQTITYKYEEPGNNTALTPDIEVTLSDTYTSSVNSVARISGEVSALAKQLGAISNVEAVVRAVGDKLYLRKDGVADRSLSPTQFFSLLTSNDWRQGILGGNGWGFFKDLNGNWVLETDKINVRQDLQVNNLIINQITARGGMIVESAANMEITNVTEDSSAFTCYFDTKGGSVANLFAVDDIAYCSRYNPDNTSVKFYKRRVTAVGLDYIVLTKGYTATGKDDDTGVNGSGIPEIGDVVVQYGNYTDTTRQYVKVRDVIGGGYERYIEQLDSANSNGVEYYFVGRLAGAYSNRPRWYIGDDNGYIEWLNGELNIKGKLSVGTTYNGKQLDEYFTDLSNYVADTDIYYIQTASATLSPILPVLNENGDISNLNGWSTNAPTWQQGEYIWQTTYVKKGDNSATFSSPICVSGKDGRSIERIAEEYYLSTSRTELSGGEWSETRPDWVVGRYYWTRTHIYYTDGTEEIIGEICVTGNDGASSYLIDLTNETIGVIADADGFVVSGAIPYTAIRVYKGSELVTSGVTYSVVSATNITAVVDTSGYVNFDSFSQSETTASAIVQAVVDGLTLQATVSLYKVRPGADGSDAVVYSILTSTDCVTRNVDGSLSASSITCTKYKRTGSGSIATTTENRLTAITYTNGTAGSELTIAAVGTTSGSVTLGSNTTAVVFTLYAGTTTTVLDRERVPVLTDGSGIEIGGTNLLLYTNQGFKNWRKSHAETAAISLAASSSTDGVYVHNDYTSTANSWQCVFYPIPDNVMKIGKVYTLSFTIFADTAATRGIQPYLLGYDTNGDEKAQYFATKSGLWVVPLSATHTRYSFTFKMNENYDFDTANKFYIRFVPAKVSNVTSNWYDWTDFTIYDLMLEEGNTASSWCRSPHDTDYLTAALRENTTIEGGLILASLIKLGYTSDEGYKIMSGMNGVYSPTDTGHGLAFWSGGDMIDAKDSTAVNRATFAIRMDGTAYAANNVLRFNANNINVGNDTILDTTGLHLFESNEERLTIANKAIPSNFLGTIGGSQTLSLNGSFGYTCSTGGAVVSSGRVMTSGVAISTSGASMTINLTATDDSGYLNGGTILLKVWQNGSERASYHFPFSGSTCELSYFIDLSTIFTSGQVTISVELYPSVDSAKDTHEGTMSLVGTCYLANDSANITLLGNNGLATKWGNAALLVHNTDSTNGEVVMMSGNYGFKVTPTGLFRTSDGGSNWTAM